MKKHGLTLSFLFCCCMLTLKGTETPHTGPRTFEGRIFDKDIDTVDKRPEVVFKSYCPIVEQRKHKRGLINK